MATTDKNWNSIWRVNHLATFVCGLNSTSPQEFISVLIDIDPKHASSSECNLEKNENGMRFSNEALKQSALWTWDKIAGQDFVPANKDNKDNLLVLKIEHSRFDAMGLRNEVFVFIVEDEKVGSSISKCIETEKSKRKSANKSTEDEPKSAEQGSNDSTNPMGTKYGESLYMLNRCLDDIEYFIKKLKKYLRKRKKQTDENANTTQPDEPPSPENAIETLRKVKFTLNLAETLKECAPAAFKKVFIRLIGFVEWMDELCRTKKLISTYPENLVGDVIEPLLQESTLISTKSFMDSKLQKQWEQLGTAWNTSMENWPNPLVSYWPRFRCLPRYFNTVGLGWNKQSIHTTGRGRRSQSTDQALSPSSSDAVLVKLTKPVIPYRRYGEDFERIQNDGGKICFATVPHIGAKSKELSATQGEMFELLDDSRQSWWQVRNHDGQAGHIPAWKLRPVQLTPNLLNDYQVETDKTESLRLSHYFNFPPQNRYNQDSISWSHHDRIRTHSLGPMARISVSDLNFEMENELQPIMVYLPSNQLLSNKPIALHLYPHSNQNYSLISPVPLSPQTMRRYQEQTQTLETLRSTMPINEWITWHPRVSNVYKPTIKLDRKNSSIAGKS